MAILGVAYNQRVEKPLAVRMRPKSIGEVVGHGRLLAKGSPIQRLIDAERTGAWSSVCSGGRLAAGKPRLQGC